MGERCDNDGDLGFVACETMVEWCLGEKNQRESDGKCDRARENKRRRK